MLPDRYTKIGPLTLPDHSLLEPDDLCFYLGEYTKGAGYGTTTNHLILNFKITPTDLNNNPARRKYKNAAIREVSAALTMHLSNQPAGRVVVPIPTSNLPGHADHDDRLLRALNGCKAAPPIAVRELIKQSASTCADHESDERQSFDDLLANCYLDEAVALPAPTSVIVFDDVLTSGKHFKVCQRLIRERYGPIRIIGFFIARRIRPSIDVDVELEELDA